MDESLVRYSKLSMMTATNRFSICTSENLLDVSAEVQFEANCLLIPIRNRRVIHFLQRVDEYGHKALTKNEQKKIKETK